MIDAHIHLTDERFDPDREELLEQARKAGVRLFLSASVRPEEWRKLIDFSLKHEDIRPFIGTHPWYASTHDEALFKRLLTRYPETGVGEIGLDAVKGSPEQERVFYSQMKTAAELKRPCVVHCVKSFDATAAVLKKLKQTPPAVMLHGFSGTVQQAVFFSRFNAFFSFSGNILKGNKGKLRAVLAALPRERILAETDAPDMMLPEQFRLPDEKGRNPPAALPLIVREIAAVRGVEVSSMISVLRENAERFLAGQPPISPA